MLATPACLLSILLLLLLSIIYLSTSDPNLLFVYNSPITYEAPHCSYAFCLSPDNFTLYCLYSLVAYSYLLIILLRITYFLKFDRFPDRTYCEGKLGGYIIALLPCSSFFSWLTRYKWINLLFYKGPNFTFQWEMQMTACNKRSYILAEGLEYNDHYVLPYSTTILRSWKLQTYCDRRETW